MQIIYVIRPIGDNTRVLDLTSYYLLIYMWCIRLNNIVSFIGV